MKNYHVYRFALFLAALLAVPQVFAGQRAQGSDGNQADIVVLIHGLGRSNTAMSQLAGRLENAGYEVHRVGYSSFYTPTNDMIEEVTRQIDHCCLDPQRKIHFVGHSLGGLMIRAYLQETTPEKLGNSVLLGTPNQGTEIADRYQGNRLIELVMPAALALGTDAKSLPNQLPPPHYPVGVIAGISDKDTDEDYLPGPDDGLVTVESTKLEGMADFIIVHTRHSMMRYDNKVADQVLSFLNAGQFIHPSTQ